MTIYVRSFDFDGCLFNINYIQSANKNVITHNQAFFAEVKAQHHDASKVIIFIGSNRQSRDIDLANSFMKGSCFPAVQIVSTYLEAELDTFLLADIYGDLADGTSFVRATDPGYQGDHAHWLFDGTKASILYAQMHRVASDNPTEDIVFDFYDDRGDILDALNAFYETHPRLIPSNVTLRLHSYAGKHVTAIADIIGTGFIDTNYRQTVKDMAVIALEPLGITLEHVDGTTEIHTAYHVTPALLQQRIPFVHPPLPDDIESLDDSEHRTPLALSPVLDDSIKSPDELEQIKALMQPNPMEDSQEELEVEHKLRVPTQAQINFIAQLELLKKKALSLRDQGHESAAIKASTLYDTLSINYQKYCRDKLSKDDFRGICDEAMRTARPELEKHRGWKQLLGNLGLAIAGLGIGYVIAGLINVAITGHFLLFRPKTDSLQKLELLEKSIEQVAPCA